MDWGYFPIGYFFTGYFPDEWYPGNLDSGEPEAVVGVGAGIVAGPFADAEGTAGAEYVYPTGGWVPLQWRRPLPMVGVAECVPPEAIAKAIGVVGARASVAGSVFLPTSAARAVQAVAGGVLEHVCSPAAVSRGAVGLSGDVSVTLHAIMPRAIATAGARGVARCTVPSASIVAVADVVAVIPCADVPTGISGEGRCAIPYASVGAIADVGNIGHATMAVQGFSGKSAMERGVAGSMSGRFHEVRAISYGDYKKFNDEQIQEIIAALLMAA